MSLRFIIHFDFIMERNFNLQYGKVILVGLNKAKTTNQRSCFIIFFLDINECALYPEICPYPSRCRNTIGGHTCDCPKGFISHRQKICVGKQSSEI